MLLRRAAATGIKTKIGNHSLRATGITDYLKNNGTLNTPRRWPTTPRRAPLNSTTGAPMRSASMSISEYEKVGI
jgi:hypothetical protein